MKKEIVITPSVARAYRASSARTSLLTVVLRSLSRTAPVVHLSNVYSRLLGEPVEPLFTLKLLNAQLSFLLLVFPLPFLWVARALMFVWFAVAVWQCRRTA